MAPVSCPADQVPEMNAPQLTAMQVEPGLMIYGGSLAAPPATLHSLLLLLAYAPHWMEYSMGGGLGQRRCTRQAARHLQITLQAC